MNRLSTPAPARACRLAALALLAWTLAAGALPLTPGLAAQDAADTAAPTASETAPAPEATTEAEPPIPVAPPPAIRAYRGTLRSVLLPIEDLRLSIPAQGIIKAYHIEEGQPVKVGDLIMELEAAEEEMAVSNMEAVLEGARAELKRAQSNYDRAEKLYQESIQSERQYEEAQYNLAVAQSRLKQTEATLEAARVRLEKTRVKSPIDGLFLKKYKSVGESVDRFETVARILDNRRLELVVYCGPQLLGKLKTGSEQTVEILDGPAQNQQVTATTTYVDPLIDPSSGTFRVKLEVTPRKGEVVAGLAAKLIL